MAAGFRLVNPSAIRTIASRPGPEAVGAVAMAPIDADPMARAGAFTGSSSSGSGSSKRGSSRGTGVRHGAVDGRAVRIAVRSRAAALQGTAVDAALEELGAPPSLLGSDGLISSRDRARARRSVP
jgi:hypothetical protein